DPSLIACGSVKRFRDESKATRNAAGTSVFSYYLTVLATSSMTSWVADRHVSRLRRTFSRYRDARKSFQVPDSGHSRRRLDWTNFFIADLQTGFGSFIVFYLASLGWSQQKIGLALAIASIMAVLSQAPAGALADSVTGKRVLGGIGIVAIAAAALVLAL